tara:strand:+ start:116 stop:889 length:774 start_codon:yes stop_codon:yes gene_type:complete
MNNNANITTKTTDQSSGTTERNISCTFSDKEDPSPNYLRRVKAHHAGAFVTGVNELTEVLEGDILIKLPGKNPWFAQYRELVELPDLPDSEALTVPLTVPKGATLEEFTDGDGSVGATRVTLADGTLMLYGNTNLIPVQDTPAEDAEAIATAEQDEAVAAQEKADKEDADKAAADEAAASNRAAEAAAFTRVNDEEDAAVKAATDKKEAAEKEAAEDKKAAEEVEAKAAQEKAAKKAAADKKAADKKAKAAEASQGK